MLELHPVEESRGDRLSRLGAVIAACGVGPECSFAQAAGRVLQVALQELGADAAFIMDTKPGTASRLLAAARATSETGDARPRSSDKSGGGGGIVPESEFPELASTAMALRVSRMIDGVAAGIQGAATSGVLARPFALQHQRAGIVACVWERPRDLATEESQQALVDAVALWSEREWSRRAAHRRETNLIERRYRALAKGTNDGLFEWDLATNRIDYSTRCRGMLGYGTQAVADTPDAWLHRVDRGDLAQLETDLVRCLAGQTPSLRNEHRLSDTRGGSRWMLCRGELVSDETGRPLRLVGSLSDTTEFKMAEQKLRRAAEHDKLTDLPNRATMHGRLTQAIRRCRATGGRHRYALMFLDFDRFKLVNDSLGHDAGDRLLMQIAERLRQQVRDSDTAARLGGDEFVILLEQVESFEAVLGVARRLLEAFGRPFDLDGHDVTVTASIGVVDGAAGYEHADAVIRDADSAMYHAKGLGKARYSVFDQHMQDQSFKRLELERELRQAIGSDQLFTVYQPILDVHSRQIAGFEALVRWQHPQLGVVRPDHFIELAEETGLIVPLGMWVLETACRDLARLDRIAPHRRLTMNVNLSRRQLVQPDVVESIRRVLQQTDTQATRLRLEITESVIMDSRAALVPVLGELRDMGIQLAMDDFGTGHSSLSCLHQFPVNVLKIDRSFVHSLEQHHEFAAVIQAIVTLAHTLGMTVVAEGIETAEQLEVLESLSCDYLQGYLFARPLGIEEAGRFLIEPHPMRRSA